MAEWALGRMGLLAIAPLVECLKDPEQYVRQGAARALKELGYVPPDEHTRAIFLVALEQWDVLVSIGKPAVEPLVACLGNQQRRSAAETLQRIGYTPSDEQSRITFLIALGKWDEIIALGRPAVGLLVACLNDDNEIFRRSAAETLEKIGYVPPNDRAKVTLLFALKKSEELVGVGEPTVEILVAYMKSQDIQTSAFAADALGKVASSFATGARGRIGQPALDLILACLKDPSRLTRLGAIEALGKTGDPRAVEPLIVLLKDPSGWDCSPAAEALGRIGDPRAIESLVRCVEQDENADNALRTVAAEALGRIGKPAFTRLVALLNNKDPRVRTCVVKALGMLDGGSSVEPLIACLGDVEPYVRQCAAESLGKAGGKRAVDGLRAALPDWDLGPFLASSLKKLGWQPSTDQQRVYLWTAERDAQQLSANWEMAKQVLVADCKSNHFKRVENAVCTIVCLGRDELIPQLIQDLNQQGSKEIAEIYLNCGHKGLEEAAHTWANLHGYTARQTQLSPKAGWNTWGR